MGDNWTITLYPDPRHPLPAVLRLELGMDRYRQLEDWLGGSDIYLVNELNGAEIACQLNQSGLSADPSGNEHEYALYLLIHKWPAEDTDKAVACSVRKKPKPVNVPQDRVYNPWAHTSGVYLDHQQQNARVVVSIEGELFTRYLYSPDVAKPYYYPLIGPNGKTLIQDGPDDHLHHHGLWWGHDDVNGHRLYHEFRGEGRQVHRSFLSLFGGPVFGQITSLVDWNDEDGNLLLQETRTVRLYNMPKDARYMDICTELHGVNGDVRFGDTKEGGFPFIRVNEQINGHLTGTLTAANGKQGEEEIFGSVTEWVDYSGTILAHTKAGIAAFAHPSNETFASQWFVRDYGPFTPANFHFCGGYTLVNGTSLRMKHRLYIHQGDVVSGKVKERYDEYIQPAEVKLDD